MKIEAENLQIAYMQAAERLKCSVTELDIKVIQHPSKGILGLFKKTAIIEVSMENKHKNSHKTSLKNSKNNSEKSEHKKPDTQTIKSDNNTETKPPKNRNKKQKQDKQYTQENQISSPQKEPQNDVNKNGKKRDPKHNEKRQKRAEEKASKTPAVNITDEVITDIKDGLKKLFYASCFNISSFEVSKFDEQSVYIKLDGEDAALLIGKEGYRYKAISYLIYNWINLKYGLNIRLEIAEFFKNQEIMISEYLENIIQRINENGKANTKPLDGILVKIALEQLREKFPDKYVGVRTGREGKFVVVNDFHKNNE